MDSDQYTCRACGRTFDKQRSDAVALAEAAERFGAEAMAGRLCEVCDDCWNWMNEVESISRHLCTLVSQDAEQFLAGDIGMTSPAWMLLIPIAKLRAKLPSPAQLAADA